MNLKNLGSSKETICNPFNKNIFRMVFLIIISWIFMSCGLKVVKANESNQDVGTKMLDLSSGKPKIVSTIGCHLKSGSRSLSASAKTEKEARAEVLARCRDATVVSFCKEEEIRCSPN